MRLLTVVALKEFIDNFRDKRAVLSALVFGPLFGPVLFGVLVSFAVDKAVSEVDEKIELAVSGAERAPNFVRFLEQNEIVITPVEVDANGAREAVRTGKHALVMLIPEGYATTFASAQPAAVQLYSEGKTLTESAHAAGFADSAHFSRAFRRTFGLPATTLTRL